MKTTTTVKPKKPYPDTPELAKMKSVQAESQIIGAFLDHLGQAGLCLAEYNDRDQLVPVGKSIEQTLAGYFEIDLQKVEKEREALLEHIRS